MSDPQQPHDPQAPQTPGTPGMPSDAEGHDAPPSEAPGAAGPDGEPLAPPSAGDETSVGRRGLATKIVAAVVVLLLVGGGIAIAVVSLTGPTNHELTLTDSAGGMERATEVESQLEAQLEAAEQQFVQLAESGADEGALEYTRVGVYQQDDQDTGPVGAMVFIGAKSSVEQEPSDYISGVAGNAEENGFETEPIAVGDGAEGVCATQDAGQVITICAWATNDTVGQLVPTVPDWTPEQLAPLLLDVRADVETTD